jgi:hypothetical protein
MQELKKHWLKRVCVDADNNIIEDFDEEEEDECIPADVDGDEETTLGHEEDDVEEDDDDTENHGHVTPNIPYPLDMPNGFVQNHQQVDWTSQPGANYWGNPMMFPNPGYNY